MLTNPLLKTDDNIAFVCTGNICTSPDHPLLTQQYVKNHYQLDAHFKEDTFKALPAKERAAIFLHYLFSPDIKLIVGLRGGEGTADILPYIHEHYQQIKQLAPKTIIGYSDTTALLVYFEKYYHWPVIHGATPLQFMLQKVDKATEQITMNYLLGKSTHLPFTLLQPLNAIAATPGTIEAELTGGCLSLIDISIKDIWEIDTTNKILFFEDVSEKAHKVIRFLKYFKRIGLFDQVKAVIFGDFTAEPIGLDVKEQERNRDDLLRVLNRFAAEQTFPVLYTPEFGHGRVNIPFVYSHLYSLKLGNSPSLTLKM